MGKEKGEENVRYFQWQDKRIERDKDFSRYSKIYRRYLPFLTLQ